MSLDSIYGMLEKISRVPGRIKKEKIFAACLDANYDFVKVVKLALDPHINFHTQRVPFEKSMVGKSVSNAKVFSHLKMMASKTGATKEDIKRLGLLSSTTHKTLNVIKRIVTKDLDCGIGIKTAKKHVPDIKEYPVMLCTAQSEQALKRITFPAVSDVKEDGGYTNARVYNRECTLFSKDGREVHLKNPQIYSDFIRCHGRIKWPQGVVFIGEAVFFDEYGVQLSRKKSNGKLNKGIQGTITVEESMRCEFRLWDVVRLDKFLEEYWDLALCNRRGILNSTIHSCSPKQIVVVKSRPVKNFQESVVHYNEVKEDGEEGTILKNIESPWENKRSPHYLKVKEDWETGPKDCDLVVVGYKPHTKHPSKIGSLICETSDGLLRVGVGSGLTKKDRDKDPNYFIGKIIEVKYGEVIDSDSKDLKSLYLPRLHKDFVRDDKTEAYTLSEVE